MFKLLRKVIDEKTLRHYCAALTGAMPTSSPYGRDKIRKPCPTDIIQQNQLASMGLKKRHEYELVFSYDNKDESDDELIYMNLDEYYDKEGNHITFWFHRITDSAYIALAMTEGHYDEFGPNDRVTQADVEMAVEVAKWMVAVGMSNGRVMANDIISRKQFAPNQISITQLFNQR